MSEPFRGSAGSKKMSADRRKKASASETKDILAVGAVYRGKVVGRSATNTYTVAIDSPGCQVSGVRLASAMFSGLLGFKDSRVLAADTQVAVVYSNPGFIIGTFPSNPSDEDNGGNRSAVWGDAVSEVGQAGQYGSTNVPEDLVEGEFDYANHFGVGLLFLTSMMSLKAGDMAKVETHLINDMVRIVSKQFRHIHGLGDDLIFDHGRPTMERGWASYRHELMGKLKEPEPLFELKGDEIDKETIDRLGDMARYRYLEYVGWMGDFIHRFVCDPPAELVKMTQAATGRRAGKFWEHVGADGSYVVQSTAEIRLERVTRIPVPHRVANHEAPSVTQARNYRALKKDFLKAWDYGSQENKDAYRTTYQLRQYARWLTRFQAFARTLQLNDNTGGRVPEFDITSEAASPAPDWNNSEDDRKAVNADLEYFEAYSCYCILRDGSQLLHDGYGSSVVMSNGNVQVSASRHLDLEAAGDIRMAAGGSIFMKARRHVEVSASAGGIILHSYAFFRALCEKGSMWFRSDAGDPSGDPPAPKAGVTPEIPPEVLDSAILIETANWKTAIRSEKQLSLTVEGSAAGDGLTTDEADIVLTTKGSLRVRARKNIILGASRKMILSCRSLATKASRWYGDLGEVVWDSIYMAPKAGLMQLRMLDTIMTRASGAFQGPEVGPIPIPNTRPPVGPHHNHIQILKKDIVWKQGNDEDAAAALAFAGPAVSNPTSPWEKGASDARWGFLDDATYYWDGREERSGALVQTITQQYIQLDNPAPWGEEHTYEVWNWKSDRLTIGKRVGENKLGFGGNAVQYRGGNDSKAANLHVPGTTAPAALGAATTNWVTGDVNFRILKQTTE